MKKLLLLTACILLSHYAIAQQALWGGASAVSPEINENGTVTFRFTAPKSVSVKVTGDFLPTRKINTPYGEFDAPGIADLKEGENGLWEYTTPEKLEPESYNYSFLVDGLNVLDPNNMFVNRDVSTLTSKFIVPGGRADLYTIREVPHGTVSKLWYHSNVAGFDRRMSVYTPAGYENGKGRYPVVYILHGMGGDEDAWLDQGRAAQILDNLIAQGKAKPMIAVFTNGNISQEAAPLENANGYDRPSMNLPKTMDGSFETSFPEVVKYVDAHYRTIAKKQGRAICGLSMGGFHTLWISLNNPDSFNYSGMFSAAIGMGDLSKAAYPEIYSDMDAKLAKYFAAKPALLWIGIGTTDFLYESNKEFRAKLDAKAYPYEYRESDGGHIWRNWRIYLSEFLPKLF